MSKERYTEAMKRALGIKLGFISVGGSTEDGSQEEREEKETFGFEEDAMVTIVSVSSGVRSNVAHRILSPHLGRQS